MAGQLSLGVQPGAPARSAGHAGRGRVMEREPAALQPEPSAVGVPGRCVDAEGRLPGHGRSPWPTLEDRARRWPANGSDPTRRRPFSGLLLLHPGPRNRPRNPARNHRRTTDRRTKNFPMNVKDGSRRNVKDVPGFTPGSRCGALALLDLGCPAAAPRQCVIRRPGLHPRC
jgi:hypothetical protein